MKVLRIILAETSAGLCLGVILSLVLAHWTWFEITPEMAFNTGLMMLAGALAGFVWSLFGAVSKERLSPLVTVIPIASILATVALSEFDWHAAVALPGHLLGEAIGLPSMSPYWVSALLALAMLPALLLPMLPWQRRQ